MAVRGLYSAVMNRGSLQTWEAAELKLRDYFRLAHVSPGTVRGKTFSWEPQLRGNAERARGSVSYDGIPDAGMEAVRRHCPGPYGQG